MRLEPMLHNKRSHCNEKSAHRNEEENPLGATRGSPRTATKTQHSKKIKINNFFKKDHTREFAGGPVVRTAGGAGSIPGWGTKIPHAM